MQYDPDIPLEWTEYEYGQDIEDTILVPSYADTQRTNTGGGNRLEIIISGTGTYAQKLNKLNSLNREDRAIGRAILVAQDIYRIHDSNYLLNTIERFNQLEYRNMTALIGSILFYEDYNLSKKENSIHQADLSSFYKKYPKINSELSKEDLIRYIRLTIKILNKK